MMWSGAGPHASGARDYSRYECGLMAHRKDLFSRSAALAVPVLLLGVVLLAGVVYISNQVVACRLQIARLDDRREYLDARSALLQARWNALTRADVIQARATREIGLVQAEQPHLVLLQATAGEEEKYGLWRRVLAHFGGGTSLEAATDPLVGAQEHEGMVSLEPVYAAGEAP